MGASLYCGSEPILANDQTPATNPTFIASLSSMNLKTFLLFILLVIPMTAHSIVMRHDVDESQYLSSFEAWPTTAYFHLGGKFGNGTGTLIAPQWVLTAGHVAHFLKTGDAVTINATQYTIKKVIPHPQYELYDSDNDIGLIELDVAVTDVTPASLYQQDDEAGKLITFVGAGDPGTGETGAQGQTGVIRAATNRIEATRKRLLVFSFDAPPDTLPKEGISGPGDSGGPAYLVKDGETFVLGVSAFQGDSLSGVEGVYGVKEFYSRVSAHIDWINSTINH